MSFSYSINNGTITGTCNTKEDWNTVLNNNKSTMTQCTLSGTAPIDMSGMFYGCSSLTNLDLSNFNTSNVTSMSGMFRECISLTSLDLSNFNTTRVTNIAAMFYGCSSLTNIDLSNFNMSNATNMTGLFYGCSALIILDLSNFSTNNVTNMTSMFEGCINLKHIYVSSSFVTTRVSSSTNMFYNCTKLPNFNSSTIDKTKAFVGAGGYLENLADALNTAEIYYKHNNTIFKLKEGENFPTIEVTATGSYVPTGGNSPYGACINKDGYMVIYAYSYNSNYEHYNFTSTSIPATFGTIADGWNLTSTWDTSDNATHLEACTIKGINVSKYSKIKVALNFTGANASYDYVHCDVTITTE